MCFVVVHIYIYIHDMKTIVCNKDPAVSLFSVEVAEGSQ